MITGRRVSIERRLPIIERTLFALAAILLGWYVVERGTTAYEQAAASRQFESVHMAVANPASSVARAVTGTVMGRVEIPRLGLSAMVLEGDDEGTLRHAVGHIPDTALPGEPGNAGLAGHRDTFFRPLRNVRAGDRITVTTARGPLDYTVQSTRIVDPDDVSVLNPTPHQTLTLVTCYPFYYIGAAPRRFIVHAELTQDRRQ